MAGTLGGFENFGGNSELKSGIDINIPIANLESVVTPEVINGLRIVDAIMPAKSQTLFMTPRIFGDMFDWIPRSNVPFGSYTELAMFMNSPPSKKRDGRCMSFGDAQLYAEQYVTNWAYNISISLKDREISRGVNNEETARAYYAGKMMTPVNTMRLERNARWKQLFSDVVDGTRSIPSTTSSDGTGETVAYNVNVKGYCGRVETTDTVVPELIYGSPVTFSGANPDADILEILDALKNASSWAEFASNEYAKGLNNPDEMTIGGTFNIIMEKAVLNAMDSVWRMSPTYKGLSISARAYIREFLNGSLIEIDKFPALPTSDDTVGKRLLSVLIDTDAPREFVAWEDVRAEYCMQPRLTTYNYQGEGASGIFKGLPAYAMTAMVV